MKQPDISDLLRRLHDATGFRISIHDREMNEIAAFPEEHLDFCRKLHAHNNSAGICMKSDANAFRSADEKRGLHVYKCPFGLFEAVCPLYRYGTPVGYLMMGQVTESKADTEEAARRAERCCSNGEALYEAAKKIPCVSQEMMLAYADIMSVFADYMTVSNLINVKITELPAQIYDYLLTRFSEKITLERLCGEFLCSRTHILESFHAKYGCSVSDALTEIRLKNADRLLAESDMPIKNIAAECGFKDAGYFARVYAKVRGMTPTEARNLSASNLCDVHLPSKERLK